MSIMRTLKPSIAAATLHTAKPPPKRADKFYLSREWFEVRDRVRREARGRCEAPGCGRAERRMFVDHIVELKDGGAALDRSNLWLLCGGCHSLKTAAERTRRTAQSPRGRSTDVEKVLRGELADMCFTDPPYGVDYANSPKDKQRGKHRPILNDHPGAELEAMLLAANTNVLGVTKGAIYVCMASAALDTLQKVFRDAGGRWSTFVIWAKHTFTLGRPTTSANTSPFSTVGRTVPTTSGAAHATKAMFGISIGRPETTCIRR